LLDRKGTIRLIRTGSSSSNAEDLKKAIEELLGE
jgi:hypothetical protein